MLNVRSVALEGLSTPINPRAIALQGFVIGGVAAVAFVDIRRTTLIGVLPSKLQLLTNLRNAYLSGRIRKYPLDAVCEVGTGLGAVAHLSTVRTGKQQTTSLHGEVRAQTARKTVFRNEIPTLKGKVTK